MTSDEGWVYDFPPRAAEQFDSLDPHVQDRSSRNLEVIESE